MKIFKKRMLAGTLVFSLFMSPAIAADYHFSDVGEISWAASSVEKLYQEGIISGVSAKQFAPHSPITRAELVSILNGLVKNKHTIRTDFPFKDVHTSDWYYSATKNLYGMGIIEGVSNNSKFEPRQPVTREEAAVILAQSFDISYQVASFPPFIDAETVSPWAKEAVASLTKKGAFSLFGNQIQAKKALTRAEVSVILHKIMYGEPAPYNPPKVASRSNQMLDQRITNAISSGLGVPYRYGGTTMNGFDCSGYTSHVYKNMGVNLPRTSGSQFNVGKKVSLSDMQKGDLIFFDTGGGRVSHVGIYVGDNKMAHAPSSGGKSRIDNLNWYTKNYRVAGVKRVL